MLRKERKKGTWSQKARPPEDQETNKQKGWRSQQAEFYREEQLERAQFGPWAGEFRVGVGYASQEDSVAGGD